MSEADRRRRDMGAATHDVHEEILARNRALETEVEESRRLNANLVDANARLAKGNAEDRAEVKKLTNAAVAELAILETAEATITRVEALLQRMEACTGQLDTFGKRWVTGRLRAALDGPKTPTGGET